MKKTIKNYCLNATESKLTELYEIAQRYAKVKNEVFMRYGSVDGLQYLSYPREIRDEWVKTGHGNKFGLQARQWKMAFDEAFANITSKWANVANDVRISLSRNKSFTNNEKHYAYYLLKSPSLLYKTITFKTFKLPSQFAELDIDILKVHKYLKSRLRKHFGEKPHQHKTNSFAIDSNMYDLYKDAKGRLWIGITGLEPRKRIHLLLRSTVEPKKGSSLKVVLKAKRIEIHHTIDVEVKETNNSNVVAIDKGFTEVVTSSSNKRYGLGFNEILKEESNRLSEKNKRRNKLRALVKKYEEKGNFAKAEAIKVSNLGKRKYNHQGLTNKDKLKTFINTAIGEFIQREAPSVVIQEDLTFSNWSKKLSKKVKRYFSSWLKGYIKERLEYLSKLNGVKLETVNAAYTSQVCHICGRFGKRTGDRFYCAEHGEMDADYNASLNILARYFDTEINLYTSYKQVKAILQERLRLSNQDSRHFLVKESQTESELTQCI